MKYVKVPYKSKGTIYIFVIMMGQCEDAFSLVNDSIQTILHGLEWLTTLYS